MPNFYHPKSRLARYYKKMFFVICAVATPFFLALLWVGMFKLASFIFSCMLYSYAKFYR